MLGTFGPRPLAAAAIAACLTVSMAATVAAQDADSEQEGNVLVARVGEVEIRLMDLLPNIMTEQQQGGEQDFKAAYDLVLEQRIEQLLIVNAAIAAGLRDEPVFAERIRRIEQDVLSDMYLRQQVVTRVSEADVRARYDTYVEQQGATEEVKASHILFAAEAEAVAARAALDAGTDFRALPSDPAVTGIQDAGDLGYFSREAMLPAIAEAAFATEVGTASGPTESPFGWHLILVEDRRSAPVEPYEAMQQSLFEEMARVVVGDIVNELRGQTDIQRFEPDGQPRVEE